MDRNKVEECWSDFQVAGGSINDSLDELARWSPTKVDPTRARVYDASEPELCGYTVFTPGTQESFTRCLFLPTHRSIPKVETPRAGCHQDALEIQ